MDPHRNRLAPPNGDVVNVHNPHDTRLVVFFPEASFGAVLNCITTAQELRARGVVCKFIARAGFAGVFREYGFEEHVLPHNSGGKALYWAEFLSQRIPHFKDTPQDQLHSLVAPTFAASLSEVAACQDALAAALDKLQPDLVVIDDVIMYPAIVQCGVPWVRLSSIAETEVAGAGVPPYLSGQSAGLTAEHAAFNARYLQAVAPVHAAYNALRRKHGAAALPDGVFMEDSPYLNVLIAPESLRFARQDPLPEEQFLFLEHNVRQEYPFSMPDLPHQAGPLVYLSFGSLGSLDSGFIRKLLPQFATYPARFLVNVGTRIDDYSDVPDNVHLQAWFPQPSVVATCDVFIHHGGLSSTCEALLNGVPSLIIPYFWDGHDIARRVADQGLGRYLPRQGLAPWDVTDAIDAILADRPLLQRLSKNSAKMQRRPATQAAADRMLALIADREPVVARRSKTVYEFTGRFPP